MLGGPRKIGQKENEVRSSSTSLSKASFIETDLHCQYVACLSLTPGERWRRSVAKLFEPSGALALPHHRQQDQQRPRHPQRGREEA